MGVSGCNFSSMVRAVSTHVVLAFFLLSGACVDPKKRFDEFGGRVVDASPRADAPPQQIQDITGQFLLAIDPKPINPGKYVRYIADATLQEENGDFTVNIELRPIDFETLQLVPDVAPNTWTGVAIDATTATFTLPLVDAVIPGRANAIIPGLDVSVNGELSGATRSADFWCGGVAGQTNLGTQLDGSTFGAQRITPGTIGDALPPPIGECDANPGEVDAGVPDAAPPDASPPDASPPDASPPDASAFGAL